MPLLQPNQVGIREELADYIAIVDQKSTPFTSMAPKGKDLGNMTFSWQVDNYADPVLAGVVDGTDISNSLVGTGTTASGTNPVDVTLTNVTTGSYGSMTNPVQYRTRLSNYAQAFRRNFRIGFIAQTQNVAGVTDEVANGISKTLIQLKRDLEATFTCTNQYAQIDNGSVPYLTSSLGNWLTNTAGSGVGNSTSTFLPNSGDAASGAYAVTTSTSANLTETVVQNMLTNIYTKTGVFRDYDAIVGTTLKRAFTNLTAATPVGTSTTATAAPSVRTFNTELTTDTFKSSIDIFEGDFGRLILHPTTFIGGKNSSALSAQAYKGYILPMDMVEIRYSKLPEVKEVPDYGGGPARIVQAIAGLVVKNPNGFGMFNGAS
ncbi:MAG: hypothetical protein RLZ69_668 [Actinomycetota bacterium]